MSAPEDFRFAMVPEELIYDLEVSPGAVRLYAALHRHANDNGKCWPGRSHLKTQLGCKTLSTVDRWIKQLVDRGWIAKEARYDDAGDRSSNLFTVHQVRGGRIDAATPPQECGDGGCIDEARGGRTDRSVNESHVEREQLNDLSKGESLFKEFVSALGRTPTTASEKKSWENASNELAAVGVTPEYLSWVAVAWEDLGWDRQITPKAVAANWSTLADAIRDASCSRQDYDLVFGPQVAEAVA